jgi:hypothetical protein
VFLYFFLLKYGREVVLAVVSLENIPGSVFNPTLKLFALPIPVTTNVLLNPEFPTPAVLDVVLILTTSTSDPTERL